MTEREISSTVRDCLNNCGDAADPLNAAALFVESLIHNDGWSERDGWLVWTRAASAIRQVDAVVPAQGQSFGVIRRRNHFGKRR